MVIKTMDRKKQAEISLYCILGLSTLWMGGQYKTLTQPVAEAKAVSPTATPSPTPVVIKMTLGEIEEIARQSEVELQIIRGFEAYAPGVDLPIEKYIPKFVEATKRYEIFKKNPYLLPAISILETSGGRNITRNNNPLNWAARVQKKGLYNPESWDKSIEDAITAIGGRIDRGSNAEYYHKFRLSNDLHDFTDAWEPNDIYYGNLVETIKLFENAY